MPVVPVRPVSTVTTRVGATAQTSPLGGVATGLANATNAITPVALDIQMRENADRVMSAEIKLRDAEREWRNSVEARKGEDVFGVTQESQQWWADKTQEIGNDLKNDAQRKMFNDMASQRRHVSLDTISGYEALERRNSVNRNGAAVIEDAKTASAEQPYNTAAIAIENQRIKDMVADLADSNGWTEGEAKVALEDHLTAQHTGVINALMVESPLAAQAYFNDKKNNKEIHGEARETLRGMIRGRVIEYKAQSFVDKYYAGTHSRGEVNKRIAKITDPDLKKAARAELRARYADDVVATQESQERAVEIVRKWLSANPTLQKKDIDQDTWQAMSGTDQLSVEAYMLQRDRNKIDPVTVDNFTYLREAEELLRSNLIRTPEDLEPYMPFLQEATRERLRKAARMNETVNPKELLNAYEVRIQKTQKEWDKWGVGNEWKNWANVQDYVYDRVREGAQGTDIEALVNEFYTDGHGQDDNWWFDPDDLYESLRAGRSDWVLDVPGEHKSEVARIAATLGQDPDAFYTSTGRDIINSLDKLGLPVSTPNLSAVLYLRSLNEQRARDGQVLMPYTPANINAVIRIMNAD